MFSEKFMSRAKQNPYLIYEASFKRLQAHQADPKYIIHTIDQLLALQTNPILGSMALLTLTHIITHQQPLVGFKHAQKIIAGVLQAETDPRLISATRDKVQALQSFAENKQTIVKNFGVGVMLLFDEVTLALAANPQSTNNVFSVSGYRTKNVVDASPAKLGCWLE